MRIIFIPGLGEDEFIFEKLQNTLPGEELFLSLWKELPNHRVSNLNAMIFALDLIDRYQITANDLIIGHSTGGWVALYIKQVVGARVIQIASWTDRKKVVTPTSNRRIIYFAAQSGLYLNHFVLRYAIKKRYQGQPSKPVFEQVFKRLVAGNRANAVNQLRLIFNPVPVPLKVVPDLRIHAKADPIVHFPDGPVCEVPGDHFALYTYPEAVLQAIHQFLKIGHEE
jgi:pimeloyl-ACP methyl ester carboxylesterase